MAKVTIKTPITTFYNGQYVAPGTDVEIEEADAKRLIGEHGEYGGATRMGDPGNTQTLNVLDQQSIDELNKQAAINKGFGKSRRASDEELDAMTKAELLDYAEKHSIAVEAGASKADVMAAVKAA
jgi:hypothetical protein